MSENIDNAMTALAGSENGGSEPDYKSMYEQSQRELQKERVEAGRLKKTMGELEALRKENEAMKSSQVRQSLIEAVPENERTDLPESVLNAAATMAEKAADGVSRRLEEIERRSAESAREASKRAFFDRVNSSFPGFIHDIQAGGDKSVAWNSYLRHNRASVVNAIEGSDYETMVYHIKQFFTSTLGIQAPSGATDQPTYPEPRSSGGGMPAEGGDSANKHYTIDEFNVLERKADDAKARGDIDAYRRLTQEMDNILSEGRIG